MEESAPVKKLKLSQGKAHIIQRETKNFKRIKDHVKSLTIEEGALLIEKWERSNYNDLGSWLKNACAQATFQIEEKISFNSKPSKNKTVQIKNFQCHIQLKFADSDLNGLIANGFGKSKKEAKRTALRQLTTFLVQKNLIKYGLKDKTFLYRKNVRSHEARFKKMPVPDNIVMDSEGQKEVKLVKGFLKKIQFLLKEKKFEKACVVFMKILKIKKPTWNEVSYLWSYAVKERSIENVEKILAILESDGKNKKKDKDETIMSNFVEDMMKTQKKLISQYGFSRNRVQNPYEIFDHFSMRFENSFNTDETNEEETPITEVKELRNVDSKKFKEILIKCDQTSQHVNFFLKNNHLNSTFIPNPAQPLTMHHYDALFVQPPQSSHLREKKDPKKSYYSGNLISEMYDLLMYSGDLKFSSRSAELVYSKLKLNDEFFINWVAAYYYSHKRNMMFHEMIENNYLKFFNLENLVQIEGNIMKVGMRVRQDVIIFQNKSSNELLTNRKNWGNSHGFREGDYVLLVSEEEDIEIEVESEKKPEPEEGDKENSVDGSEPTKIKLTPPDLKDTTLEAITQQIVKFTQYKNPTIQIALLTEISKKSNKAKLLVLSTQYHNETFKIKEKKFSLLKPSIKIQDYHKVKESISVFCKRVTMNPRIQQIILSTPICNPHALTKLARGPASIVNPNSRGKLRSIINQLEDRLNPSQLEALKETMYSNLSLIQSPSGTNKILTTVEIVKSWVEYSPMKVLVYSKNKGNVQLIHMALLKTGISSLCLNNDFEPQISETDDLCSTENICDNSFYFNPNGVSNRQMKDIIDEFRVVCCGVDEILSDSLNNIVFQRILVDDANQMSEIDLILAVSKNCQQLVLLGDENLLPPLNNSLMAKSKGINLSLYERLSRQNIYKTQLNIQYSMHPSLNLFPSIKFYQNTIENGIGPEQAPLINGFNWPNPQINTAFISIEGKEEVVNGSILNKTEVKLIAKILGDFVKTEDIAFEEIGILTSEYSQKAALREEISSVVENYENVESEEAITQLTQLLRSNVTLLDESIDIEKDLIIFSTTRNNQNGDVGVLGDPKRIATLLTRARRGLIIIGNIETLVKSEIWRDWLCWAQCNRVVLEG